MEDEVGREKRVCERRIVRHNVEEYIFDMLEQLASLARQHDMTALAGQLDAVTASAPGAHKH